MALTSEAAAAGTASRSVGSRVSSRKAPRKRGGKTLRMQVCQLPSQSSPCAGGARGAQGSRAWAQLGP